MHPAPGSDSPSNAAVVGSIDSNGSRYISRTTIQASRLEMIQDLKTMAQSILEQAVSYRQQVDKKTGPWKRLIFFRGKCMYATHMVSNAEASNRRSL